MLLFRSGAFPGRSFAQHTLLQLSAAGSTTSSGVCASGRTFSSSNSSSSGGGAGGGGAEPSRPPLPPFTEESAKQKVQLAEDGWNSRDPDRVSLAYTVDSEWRNRGEFVKGREAIREFLSRKWERELDYHLRKYLWAFQDNRIAVCFEYEFRDSSGQWYRAYGNENWDFDQAGLMRKRIASINEAPIRPEQRRISVEPPGAPVPVNTWLAEQGVTGAVAEFPFGGGSAKCY